MGGEIYAGLVNNLNDQFVRVERIRHSYYIPGANVQPPSTSIAAPFLLDAADAVDPAAGDIEIKGKCLWCSNKKRGICGNW